MPASFFVVLYVLKAEFALTAQDYQSRLASARLQINIALEMSRREFALGLYGAMRLHMRIAREHLVAARAVRLAGL